MRFTRPAARSRRHRTQSGQTLVEALVASLLIGIVVVAGMGTLEIAGLGAKVASRQAWARCAVRMEMEVAEAAAWNSTYASPDPDVSAAVVGDRSTDNLQWILVVARDHDTRAALFSAMVLKPHLLAGTSTSADLLAGMPGTCPKP